MRLRFWRHSDIEGDALDPELLSVFRDATRLPDTGTTELARGRTRVANQLVDDASRTGGRFGRRLAWGTAGGGGMWAALLGTAAANKVAAAAVGISVLLAGGVTTAEVTGVGPSVLEAIGIVSPAAPDEIAAESQGGEHAADQAAVPDIGDAGDLPGQLITQLHDDGSFQLRGVLGKLVENEVTTFTVTTATGPVELDFAEAAIQVPGRREGDDPQTVSVETLGGFVGSLVFVTGTCDPVVEPVAVTAACIVERVSVLGFAGQGAPEASGQPDGAGIPDASDLRERAQTPEGTPPVETGQPDDAPPEDAPPVDDPPNGTPPVEVPPVDAPPVGAPPVTTPEGRP